MISAYTAARMQAATKLYEARQIIAEQRSLICFAPTHLQDFATLITVIDKLVNRVMEADNERAIGE